MGLFVYKRIVESQAKHLSVDIFERKSALGSGMPYSMEGALYEHITNVSGNEIPELVTPLADWVSGLSKEALEPFNIDPKTFTDEKVLPRLLFGDYLEQQFAVLIDRGRAEGIQTTVHYHANVTDIEDRADSNQIAVIQEDGKAALFDHAILCSGHKWPHRHDDTALNYFDSPYPPSKLAHRANYPIAIRGSSLTAVDAIRTLARHNGVFFRDPEGALRFRRNDDSPLFGMVMYSRHGLLPCVRFHLEEPQLSTDSLLSDAEIARERAAQDGFVRLDMLFEDVFKASIKEQDPAFYDRIRPMGIERFVAAMLEMREQSDPFLFMRAEYEESLRSVRREKSIIWKEALAELSYVLNFPAKYLSAEDMTRLQTILKPLISTVIAFVPHASCQEMLALHEAGCLDLQAVGPDAKIEAHPDGGIVYHLGDATGSAIRYSCFVDCIGQPTLQLEDIPFPSLLRDHALSPARLRFQSPDAARTRIEAGDPHVQEEGDAFTLTVPGAAITDDFEVIARDGQANPRLFILAVPYIGGFNPDYSGLDFCEVASLRVVDRIRRLTADAAAVSATG